MRQPLQDAPLDKDLLHTALPNKLVLHQFLEGVGLSAFGQNLRRVFLQLLLLLSIFEFNFKHGGECANPDSLALSEAGTIQRHVLLLLALA